VVLGAGRAFQGWAARGGWQRATSANNALLWAGSWASSRTSLPAIVIPAALESRPNGFDPFA